MLFFPLFHFIPSWKHQQSLGWGQLKILWKFNFACVSTDLYFYSVHGRKNLFLKNSETFPAGIYLFNVRNGNSKTMCGICSKLTIKITEWRHSDVFVVNLEKISHVVLMFPLLTLNNKWRLGWPNKTSPNLFNPFCAIAYFHWIHFSPYTILQHKWL